MPALQPNPRQHAHLYLRCHFAYQILMRVTQRSTAQQRETGITENAINDLPKSYILPQF